MTMTTNQIRILSWIVFIIAMILLFSISWKIAVGVLLFGWGMNLENDLKNYD